MTAHDLPSVNDDINAGARSLVLDLGVPCRFDAPNLSRIESAVRRGIEATLATHGYKLVELEIHHQPAMRNLTFKVRSERMTLAELMSRTTEALEPDRATDLDLRSLMFIVGLEETW